MTPSSFHRGRKRPQDTELVSDRAEGQTQACSAPKQVLGWWGLFCRLEPGEGQTDAQPIAKGTPVGPGRSRGRDGGTRLSEQAGASCPGSDVASACHTGLLPWPHPSPLPSPRPTEGARATYCDQRPRLQTALSIRTREAGTGWSPQQMLCSKENHRKAVTNGELSTKASK